jgi:hypothetical protein
MKSSSPTSAAEFSIDRKASKLRLAVLTAVFLTLCAVQAFSQAELGTIVGTVTDPSGAAVPNATITITNRDTHLSHTLTTGSAGDYVAAGLQVGNYSVRAQATGFKADEQNGIVLTVSDRHRVDFKLAVGSAQETITVEANTVAVQTDSSEVSTLITGQQISDLSTNGRSLYTLYALAPGAASIQGDFIAPTAVSGDNNVSINGQRAGHNLALIDGGENLDRGGSQASVAPSEEAIGEFRMETSNYSAEYGMSGATMISEVTKSGTSQFHASAWWFGRNDDLDARNYFNPVPQAVSELRANLFGFNAGGPVDAWAKQHKTFFFYNMEWRRLIQGGLLNQTVPPASEYPTATGAVIDPQYPVTDPASVPASIQYANCPGGAPPPGVAPGAPFPGNTIPACMISANAASLLTAGGKYGGIFPTPNSVNNSGVPIFEGGNNSATYVREELARLNHTFNNKVSIFGHWVSEQISQGYGTTQWSGDNLPSVGDTFGNPAYSAVVHLTYTISPTLLNEIAFNYDGNRIHIIPLGLYTAPSAFTFNRLFTGPNADSRIPSIDLNDQTGADYTANWTPWNNAANDYQIRDDVSWTKGAHQLKFGFGFMLYKKSQEYFATTEGNFNFNGSFTGYDFADFLLGDAQQYTEAGVQSTGQWNNVSYNVYAQDNWRANSRLTLNLGLRWDALPHTYEANQHSSNFYPNLYNPANAATFDSAGFICSGSTDPGCTAASPGLGPSPSPILAGLLFYENGIGIGGVAGIPKGLVNNTWNNFGPRVGFAYDLTGQGKTVIRGGFGISFDRVQGNDMYNGATNTPFDANPTVHNVSLQNPGLTISGPTAGTTITAADLPILPVGITGILASNYKLPTTYQYSAGVQQQLGPRAVLAVSYVGNQMRHESFNQEVNLPPLSDLPALVASGGSGLNQLYSYPGFGGISLFENGQNGHYNGLQVDLHGRIAPGLQMQAAYTLSRSIDPNVGGTGNGEDLNNVTNPYAGWKYDVGPSAFDRTHVGFVNFVYQIPFLRNSDSKFLRNAAGGWQIAGIVTMESGAPINLGSSGSLANSVIPNTATDRPFVTGAITYPHTVAQWFNPSAFTAPTQANGYCMTGPDCYGNLPFDALRGPGRDDWNLSFFKNFTLNESRGSLIQLRADAFNVWNHTQFKGDANNGGISLNAGSSNFGAVTNAFDPREFQLGIKLVY